VGVLGVPALAGDPGRGLVDPAPVVLAAAPEAVGGVAGALALLRHRGCILAPGTRRHGNTGRLMSMLCRLDQDRGCSSHAVADVK